MEVVTDFLFLSSKITADEMKKMKKMTAAMKLKDACLWKESYDKPRQHIKKQRHHFANNFHILEAMVFPIVMYRCESWTVKKAEH